MCGVDEEETATVYLVSGVQPLVPHFDSDAIMEALQMMMNCPVVSFPPPAPFIPCLLPFYVRMRPQSYLPPPLYECTRLSLRNEATNPCTNHTHPRYFQHGSRGQY